MLTSDVKEINNQMYSAVVDRINHRFATLLIEEINVQCTVPTVDLPRRASTLEQVLVNVMYNEHDKTCEFITIDYSKTYERKKHINKLQYNLRQKSEQ